MLTFQEKTSNACVDRFLAIGIPDKIDISTYEKWIQNQTSK